MRAYVILYLLMVQPCTSGGDDVANPDHFPPVVGDFVPQNCWNFTLGDWRQHEFYSPNFPEFYTNNTECIQLLVAPRGYRIRLDFRDDFHIEESQDCKYDFLELRDGPFGYSPLLGHYCGRRHPPMIQSASRFLWIRFKSDDSIEYHGFRAVYEYFRPDEEDINRTKNYTLCRIDVDASKGAGLVSSADISESFLRRANQTDVSVDCTWVIYTPPAHRVYVHWLDYEMSTPERCDDSFLEAYDRTTAVSSRRKLFCGGMAKDLKSASNHFYLRMYIERANLVPRFTALFTVFVHGPCPRALFNCGDNTCVNKSLVCNDHINCNFSWDEMNCRKSTQPTMTQVTPVVVQYSTVILGIVGGIIITIICFSVCITCHQRKREELRRKHALKQEERNAIEMTTLLTKTPQSSPQRPGSGAARAASSTQANHVANNKLPNHSTTINGVRQPVGPQAGVHQASETSANQSRYQSHVTTNGTHASLGGYHGAAGVSGESYRTKTPGKESATSDFDVSDILYDQPGDGTTFKRYLDVNSYNDEDSSPNPSTCNQIPAVVTVERPATPRRKLTQSMSEDLQSPPRPPLGMASRANTLPRERSPSPRPDVIQEEKYAYPELRPVEQRESRRLSLETLVSEKSDVWKPMPINTDLRLMSHPRAGGSERMYWSDVGPQQAKAHSRARPPPQEDYAQERPAKPPTTKRSPKSPSRSDSMKRKKAALAAAASNSPDIFYSRPNRGVRQHHPV